MSKKREDRNNTKRIYRIEMEMNAPPIVTDAMTTFMTNVFIMAEELNLVEHGLEIILVQDGV